MSDSFYVADGDAFVSTELTRGPWDARAQHAGPPSALAVRQVEQALSRPDLQIARVTMELLRPAPIAPLQVAVRVVRAGRNVASFEAEVRSGDVELIRARVLAIRTEDLPLPPLAPQPRPGPAAGRTVEFFPTGHEVGYHTAMETRFLEGAFTEPGPAQVWMRMRVPLLPDEAPSPWQRVVCAADSGNGVSAALDYRRWVFINPDLTVHLHRQPLGEWVLLDARTEVEPSGVGLATAALSDEHGPLGTSLQSLYIAER